jgi:hypothetical protein
VEREQVRRGGEEEPSEREPELRGVAADGDAVDVGPSHDARLVPRPQDAISPPHVDLALLVTLAAGYVGWRLGAEVEADARRPGGGAEVRRQPGHGLGPALVRGR